MIVARVMVAARAFHFIRRQYASGLSAPPFPLDCSRFHLRAVLVLPFSSSIRLPV
jgi:hypothetical protein